MPYTINGQHQDFEAATTRDGTTFVPLAKIVETLGGYVTWNNAAKVANVELGDKRVDVQEDNEKVNVAGQVMEMSDAPYISQNTLWVPLDFFQDVLGCNVSQDSNGISIRNM